MLYSIYFYSSFEAHSIHVLKHRMPLNVENVLQEIAGFYKYRNKSIIDTGFKGRGQITLPGKMYNILKPSLLS